MDCGEDDDFAKNSIARGKAFDTEVHVFFTL